MANEAAEAQAAGMSTVDYLFSQTNGDKEGKERNVFSTWRNYYSNRQAHGIIDLFKKEGIVFLRVNRKQLKKSLLIAMTFKFLLDGKKRS